MLDTEEERSRDDRADYVRQARADVLIGRIYGRVMPARLRRELRRSTNLRTRQAVRQWLGRLLTALSRLAEPLRAAAARRRRRPDEAVVRWKGRTVLATVRPGLTPVDAKRRNLEIVRECLNAAEVPHFLVRGHEGIRFRVAVSTAYREVTAGALRQAAGAGALYLQQLEQGGGPQLATRQMVRAAVADDYFRVFRFHTDPTGCLTLGSGFGCEIEFWRPEGPDLVAPRANACSATVPVDEPPVPVAESTLSPFTPSGAVGDNAAASYPSRRCFAGPIYSDIPFPVDVVYTWVDGADPEWQRRRAEAGGEGYHPHSANSARFISHDELRYSLRSVRMNMPWVRHVFLVTDRQVPEWLDREVPGLTVVDHREVFADPSVLPAFNSHAIETQLHHIDGLSEHFLYLNDDVCIGAPLTPDRFFLANGHTRYFPSPALVPFGEPHPGDIPSSAAGKNNRKLIRREFGTAPTHKMKHVPHALRRSVLAEIEERFPVEYRRTAASRFRDQADISVTSSLYHYYAFHTGRAMPGSMQYAYLDLAAPQTAGRLRRLAALRDREVFCVNDTTTDGGDGAPQRDLVVPFLESYFPVPSPHELPPE